MKYLGSAIVALSVLAFTTAASAAVVCNGEGDCWRVKKKHDYPAGLNLHIYGDDWQWEAGAPYRWRKPGPGRGYYRRGVWIGF
jgi:hypothetical protein